MNERNVLLGILTASSLTLLATMGGCGDVHDKSDGDDMDSGPVAGAPGDAGNATGGAAGEVGRSPSGGAAGADEPGAAGSGDATAAGMGGGGGAADRPSSPSGLRLTIMGKGRTPVFDDTMFAPMLEGLTGNPPTRIHATNPAPPLTSADLEDQDVVIVEDLSRAYSASEASTLATWVEEGKGLILLAGFDTDLVPATSIASSYGVAFEPTLLQPSVPAYLDMFSFPAITAGVSSLKVFGAFALTTTDTTAVVFGTLPPHTLGLALTHGAGRVAVWGDDWVVADGELDRVDTDLTKPTVQFWTNVLTWVSHRDP